MARKREQIFAGLGALLFLVTASATTIFVIFQSTSGDSSTTPPTSTAQTCTETRAETALAAPEVYKPTEAVTTLQATDLEVGTGATAKKGDCLVVQYYGTLASDGTKFDENFTKTSGFAFPLGAGNVISGWDQGLVGMKVGGTRRLVIPPSLAYGATAQGSIPANSTLVFVVKLLRIQ
jgi:FKBP-type peptidyl-prolyl cis-trans isomerase